MKKLGLLLVGLVVGTAPACITVNDAKDEPCDSCAGAKADEGTPASGGTSAGGTTAEGASGAAVVTDGGAPDMASAGAGGAAVTAPKLPATVSIEVLGALIGPGKVDGTTWDGTGTVPPEILAALADAFGYPGVDKVFDVVQEAAYQALSKPDPFGTANLDPDGSGFDPINDVTLADELHNTEDTFQPLWPMPYPGWRDQPFDEGLQVRINLYDEDLSLNDDIGAVTLNYPELLEAWQTRKSFWVRVEDQGDGQVLAVQIQVSGVTK